MKMRPVTTLYADLSPRRALAILLIVATTAAVGILRPGDVRTLHLGNLAEELDDSLVYRAVADRVHAGEGYYDAAAIELEAHGYPTQSTFNWRLPTYAWLLGTLPDASWGESLLALVVILAITMASTILTSDSGIGIRMATFGALAIAEGWLAFAEPAYFTELWAGTFILMSLCLYFNGNWIGGVVTGSMALVLRELTVPFCAIMFGFSIYHRRWREVGVWLAIFAAYALFFRLHSLEVSRRGADLSAGRAIAWLTCGGVTSILSTARMNFFLSLFPVWATACYVPLAVLGLLGWPPRNSLPIKFTTVAYLVLFSFVGQSFNFYWGWLIAPLLAIGIVRAPFSVLDLVRCVRKSPGLHARETGI